MPHGVGDLVEKARAPVSRAAISVVAQICQRAQELSGQITVRGVYHDAVIAAEAHHTFGGGGKILDDLFYLRQREFLWLSPELIPNLAHLHARRRQAAKTFHFKNSGA
ncbi:hypothetical protein SDC9_116165 [bioreactor metagenome]|uniref:Uncharacterized protein n=1 Tax=bioreactor metagenome TaxID=1076179 RepID=A0A645BX42_9ZZZZ